MGDVSDELEHDANEPGGRDAHGLTQSRRSRAKRNAFAVLLILVAVSTSLLGAWQLERRLWKLNLIAAVNARVHAPPQPAPGPAMWQAVNRETDDYLHVQLVGQFDYRDEVRVWTVTGGDEGYWLMTPLQTLAGWSVLVNRGFIPASGGRISRPNGSVSITGLLRMTEPGGAFLRANNPAVGRWYSRDVGAIIRTLGLERTAPYFVDADASPGPVVFPKGGLTVLTFRNAHLSYALTWFALAGLSLLGLRFVLRR